MSESLDELVADVMRRRADAIETMCERMLVLDAGGVLATDFPFGVFEVRLSTDVPWGEIHYRHAPPVPGSSDRTEGAEET